MPDETVPVATQDTPWRADGHEEAADPLIGSLLGGRYRVVGQLGEGGMGRVYHGEHEGIGRSVAIKVLNAEFAQHPQVVERFRREARASTTAGNEHIIDVFDLGELPDKSPYIVMELLNGAELGDLIERGGPMTVGRAARIGVQVCDALTAAHAKGIVHRDLKPENIFVLDDRSQDDFVKVLDFGISKFTDPSQRDQKLTQTGMTLGTPLYMSPEQAQGLPETDHRTDIYSLGVILFIALTGVAPFDAETFPLLVIKIVTGDIPTVSARRRDVPPSLDAIIQRCLHKRPEARFQSAAKLRDALEPFLDIEDPPELRDAAVAPTVRPPRLEGGIAADLESTAALGGDTKGPPSGVAARPERSTRAGNAAGDFAEGVARTGAQGGMDLADEAPQAVDDNVRGAAALDSTPSLTSLPTRSSRPLVFGGIGLGLVGVLAIVGALTLGDTDGDGGTGGAGDGSATGGGTRAAGSGSTPRPDRRPDAQPSVMTGASVDAPTSDAPTSDEVQVFLAALPREARVYLDDVEFPNPFRGPQPRSTTPVRLRIELDGYESVERPLLFTRDLEVIETLSPTPRSSRMSSASAASGTSTRSAMDSPMTTEMAPASMMSAMDGFRDDF